MHRFRRWTSIFLPFLVWSGVAIAQPALQTGDVVVGNGSSETGFRLITKRGSVAFRIPNQWPVLSVQSQPPVAAVALQVPNPADEGTSDSTNVAITIFDLDAEAARSARAVVGKAYGPQPVTSQYKGWTVYTQEASQGATRYTIIDGVRELPDLHSAVAVRLAWPHLRANPSTYDADMSETYHRLLDSVSAASGAYSPASNEIVRRPTP